MFLFGKKKSSGQKVVTQKEDETPTPPPQKHLTQRYDLKVLKQFSEFDEWIQDQLAILIPEHENIPEIPTTEYYNISDEERATRLRTFLEGSKIESDALDNFIQEFVTRINKLPLENSVYD